MEIGVLAPGTRLPSMRALAETLGVTVGTVYRAIELAERQGLVRRRRGSGVYVGKTEPAAPDNAESGPADLSQNQPPRLELDAVLRRGMDEMSRRPDVATLLTDADSQGALAHRQVLAGWLAGLGHEVGPDRLIVTNGAQQALTIALGALTRAGDALLVEEFTYPGIRDLARFFGLRLVPVAIDGEGLVPEALAEAARAPGARALYCMPSAQNPTTATMPQERRKRIAEIVEEAGLMVIEDDVNYRPDESVRPIAAISAERTVYVTSFSKTVAPGFRVGLIASPAALLTDLRAAAQTASWMAAPLMTELACAWIADGTLRELAHARARILERAHAVARDMLSGLDYQTEPHNPQLWLRLPAGWTGEAFAERLARREVLVAPGDWFAIQPTVSGPAVRISLTGVDPSRLAPALATLAAEAANPPGPMGFRA